LAEKDCGGGVALIGCNDNHTGMKQKTLLACCTAFLLTACDSSVSLEQGPSSISYFAKGGATDLQRCPAKAEPNWHVALFEYGGLRHEFMSPLGLICVKDQSDKYVGTYISANVTEATHQLAEGHKWFFVPQIEFSTKK
jgi:hypothetical protein